MVFRNSVCHFHKHLINQTKFWTIWQNTRSCRNVHSCANQHLKTVFLKEFKAGPKALAVTAYSSSTNFENVISFQNSKIQKHLNKILEKYIKAQTKLVAGKVKSEDERQEINEILNSLKAIVIPLQMYNNKEQDIEDLKQMVKESGEDDEEIKETAAQEMTQIHQEMEVLEQEILHRLVPADQVDNRDIILEVTAGVGGNEAFLFTEDLFNMYWGYATFKGWQFMVTEKDRADGFGGLRKASASISGADVYRCLKYEGGVHRVQRVPKTEKQGRVHTSTATVAIMPQVSEIDIKVNPKDLKIDTFRSSGAGGQHVNTTDSAVRIKHLPTGIVAECQTDRSQIKNRATAMKVLLSRLYQQQLESQMQEEKSMRKLQIGTAGRSEKIRTYNFKQDRITDHRLNSNMYSMDSFLSGGELLDEMTENLQTEAWREKLSALLDSNEDGK